ncbi:LysR family transcriptional regulator [Pseudomonas sp. H9]|uniref:LysR family transcriptional regulator n=1 Tax=Pseudomonas sp. H9 TaxID=483968 RepID=UPI001057DBF0|nr:LysR family transcriptional regulator [Pseudomonas sp. H9]TDF83840.1 LysR family transcriptional regulator [Pseudomonas sp. H9]
MNTIPDLQAWAIFAQVANSGSFARAAQTLGISQPTVSKAIARLEQRLGVALLLRTSRSLQLTSAGEQALEWAQRLLEEGRAIEAEAALQASVPSGRIRVAAPMSFGLKYLAPLLPEFRQQYPLIELDLSLDDRIVDLLAGRYDIAIRIAELPDSSLRSRRLFAVRRLLVASPLYLQRYGQPAHPKELEQHQCLIYTNLPTPERWRFSHSTLGDCVVPVRGGISGNNADLLQPALLAGQGLALQPEFLAWEALQTGELVHVLADWHFADIAIHLVTPPGGLRPVRVTLLLEFLVSHLASASWVRGGTCN